MEEIEAGLTRAADWLRKSRAVLVAAGAGMGVDSGLPDFRGPEGFWRAYPPYRGLGIDFYKAANPRNFSENPALAWGFYGHRTHLYRDTAPHEGFAIILEWVSMLGLDLFVATSNVDGQFQKAGYDPDRIVEVHGSIHHLQCTVPCSSTLWDNDVDFDVDHVTMTSSTIPACPYCGAVARPNILMFGDWTWVPDRTAAQEARFSAFLDRNGSHRMVVLEIGAGTSVPTIRRIAESVSAGPERLLVRMNPRDHAVKPPHVSVPMGALDALKVMARML